MKCLAKNKKGTEILMDYCAGTLEQERVAEIEQHTGTCIDCRNLIKAQNKVWQSLDVFMPSDLSPDFDQRLYARIAGYVDQRQALPPWRRWMQASFDSVRDVPSLEMSSWKPVLAGVAACAVLVIGLFVGLPGRFESVAPVHTSESAKPGDVRHSGSDHGRVDRGHIDHLDIDQVEQSLEDLDLLAPQPSGSSRM